MAEDRSASRVVPIGGGASFWRRYPKAVDRTDQQLLLAEEAEIQALKDLKDGKRWPGFAEVRATCGFVHWFSSEAVKRRSEPGVQ